STEEAGYVRDILFRCGESRFIARRPRGASIDSAVLARNEPGHPGGMSEYAARDSSRRRVCDFGGRGGERDAIRFVYGWLPGSGQRGWEEFGVKRFEEELQKHGKKPLEAICGAIYKSVARHGAQFDDQSMLLIRKL